MSLVIVTAELAADQHCDNQSITVNQSKSNAKLIASCVRLF